MSPSISSGVDSSESRDTHVVLDGVEPVEDLYRESFARGNEILFMVWDADVSKRVLAFGDGREAAKRKARQILGGNPDAYTVEPLTAPGVGVYLAGELSELRG